MRKLSTRAALAVHASEDKMMRAIFGSLPAGRRYRIAMRELRQAAEARDVTDKELLKELRAELKFIAKIKAEEAAAQTHKIFNDYITCCGIDLLTVPNGQFVSSDQEPSCDGCRKGTLGISADPAVQDVRQA
jgi:hypothetical protein